MQDIYIKSIQLTNFRNFKSYDLEIDHTSIILIGENGTGKTNILEAISLLSPGRGLRHAKFNEICRDLINNWQVDFTLMSKVGIAKITSNFNLASNRRLVEFNGGKITAQELHRLVNIIWVIPQMKEIFAGSLSERRKFFDRIIYNFDSLHAARINKYEYYLHERMQMLQQSSYDLEWLTILEHKIAEISLEIFNSRNLVIDNLQKTLDGLENEFPKAQISIIGDIKNHGRENIVEYIKENLIKSRMLDKHSGRSHFGIHRTDFVVTHQEKNQLAKYCSTGEQKAMIISINIAQIVAYINFHQSKPIILLDEVFIHLDNRRKEYLINFLLKEQLQCWITQTDLNGITSLSNVAAVIKLL